MKLLALLPPPQMPLPISFNQWKENALESCIKCENTRKIECRKCNGFGKSDCCECGHENECEDCNGTGKEDCKCTRKAKKSDYIDRIAHDYSNLMYRKNFVMHQDDINNLARQNARF